MEIVDANVFVRAIARDERAMARRAEAFFDALADGPVRATVMETVLAEVVFVLGSKTQYSFPRERIVEELRAILGLPGLGTDHPVAVDRALGIYEASNLDFPDALVVAHAERIGADAIVSFDRDYDRFPSVSRREP